MISMNKFLNDGSKSASSVSQNSVNLINTEAKDLRGKIQKDEHILEANAISSNKSFPEPDREDSQIKKLASTCPAVEKPVKRDSEVKSRRKRILRRIAKGKLVEKGLLRDPPKSLETRLAQSVEMSSDSPMKFSFRGKIHELEIEMILIGSWVTKSQKQPLALPRNFIFKIFFFSFRKYVGNF